MDWMETTQINLNFLTPTCCVTDTFIVSAFAYILISIWFFGLIILISVFFALTQELTGGSNYIQTTTASFRREDFLIFPDNSILER